jgi:hypothetical protein
MTIQYPCYLVFSTLLTLHAFIAQAFSDENKNITIREKKETYTFSSGNDEHPVQVKQESRTVYSCNEFRTSIPYVEFYDDLSSIDELRIFVNGDRAKYIRPEYRYYSIDNIFYSDARVCVFQLPFEKKGTESVVEMEKTLLDPRYFTSIYFTEAFDIEQKEIKVIVPRWMKVELKEMNFGEAGIQQQVEYNAKSDADIYTYRVSHLAARAGEPKAPGPSYIYPHLLVLSKYADSKKGRQQYFGKVDDLYAWYHSLVQKIDNDPAAIKARAQEITQGVSNELDKIRAVYNWVQDNIRYIAFEDGIAGFKPEKAQEVLQRKYGDCKGMANLTSELLKALGFDARLCWIGTNHIAYDYSTPSMAVDNHMICAVNHGGKRYFLDATETYIGFDQYAERIQGRQVLIENGEHFILDRIPSSNYKQNLQYEKRELQITGADLSGRIEQRWAGESKEYLLTQAHGIKKEKLQDALLQYLSDSDNKYTLSNLKNSDLNNWNADLQISYDLQHKDAVTSFGNEIYLEPDFRKEFSGLDIDTAERTQDWLFPYKYNLVNETSIAIPAGYKVQALPEALQIDREGYAFSISYQQQGNKISYKKELVVRNTRLPKSAFAQWNQDIEQLKKTYEQQIIFTKQ